jgi:hypothetical protein
LVGAGKFKKKLCTGVFSLCWNVLYVRGIIKMEVDGWGVFQLLHFKLYRSVNYIQYKLEKLLLICLKLTVLIIQSYNQG